MFRNPFSSTTIGDENPIRTLEDYSKHSHEGYRNTIELPVGNNVVPLRSDTIRLVQNGCSFHGFWSEDPNQHLKDFLKLVDSLNLDGENRKRTRIRLFQFSHRDQASNWLERLPAGSITTWEDLTTRFLAQFFPLRRTLKLRNDILMFQQHHGESLSEAWTQSWALLEDLALYDNESWNDPKDFAKPVKAIALPQDVPSTSDRRLIELENQVQRLIEVHLAPTQPTQVNKLTTSCKIYSGSHDTQYCMEDPEQTFVEYASSRTDEAGGALPSDTVKNLKLSTSLVLSACSHPTIDPQCSSHPSTSINVIKAHSKEPTISQTSLQRPGMEIKTKQPEEPEPTLKDEFQDFHLNLSVLEVLAHASIYVGQIRDSKPFDTLADLGSCVNIIPLYLFKNLNIELLEETDHVFGLANGTKSYPIGIVKDVEVQIGKLKLLNDFYVIDIKKDPETRLLVGRGYLATANVVIDYRMGKIAVGEGITRSVFGVKGVDLGEEEAPYWTTLGKRESYKPRPHSDEVGA
ncbi:MAK10-like protein [Tanacetum coccineum]